MADEFEEIWLEWGEPGKSRDEVRGNGSGDTDRVKPCTYSDFGFEFK